MTVSEVRIPGRAFARPSLHSVDFSTFQKQHARALIKRAKSSGGDHGQSFAPLFSLYHALRGLMGGLAGYTDDAQCPEGLSMGSALPVRGPNVIGRTSFAPFQPTGRRDLMQR